MEKAVSLAAYIVGLQNQLIKHLVEIGAECDKRMNIQAVRWTIENGSISAYLNDNGTVQILNSGDTEMAGIYKQLTMQTKAERIAALEAELAKLKEE